MSHPGSCVEQKCTRKGKGTASLSFLWGEYSPGQSPGAQEAGEPPSYRGGCQWCQPPSPRLQISSFIVVIANAPTAVKIKLLGAEIREPRAGGRTGRVGARGRVAAGYHRDAGEKGMENTRGAAGG